MDRRLLVVPGALLVLLFVADVSVFRWQASLRAGTPASPGSHAVVNASDLSARCADAAVVLADGNNVSIRGYRIAPGSVDLLFERASTSGEWALGDANCANRLSGVDNLRVDGESYRVLGKYSRERLDRTPLAGLAKLGCGLVGVALLAVGLLAIVHRESE
ncbi:hypothetical protein C465_15801 [Halorubrum distributum JCM 9100]|uniref:Uncharacterized protein n=2 Tax=Halorubrum distributum TaxID=29283 RepID=M0ECP5_9EURY|nr:hypothetical protein [Halorubrum distributum]ELZ44652.1 hypothetical protein C465_15801 [Halorubrum distributum JCM 9100]ELZ51660.1 hypothetical protein C466_13395 [Halorubrum distributum JCM 10118]